jgi:hypothetical protein
MPQGRHHDEICAAFMRRLKNLSLDMTLFVSLSPLPRLTLRHYDIREAIFLADVEQCEDYSVAFERMGECHSAINRDLRVRRMVHRDEYVSQTHRAAFERDKSFAPVRDEQRHLTRTPGNRFGDLFMRPPIKPVALVSRQNNQVMRVLPEVMKNGWRRVGAPRGDLLDIKTDAEDRLLGAVRRQHLPSFQSPPRTGEILPAAAVGSGVKNRQPAVRQDRQLEGMDKRDITRVREV